MYHAYRDILKVRPGFKIVENAYEKFGCTLAAIQATQKDLIAKKEIESFGWECLKVGDVLVSTIYAYLKSHRVWYKHYPHHRQYTAKKEYRIYRVRKKTGVVLLWTTEVFMLL